VHAEQLYENGILSVAVATNDDECSSHSRPLWIIGVVIGGILLLVALVLVVGYILHRYKKVNVFYWMLWSPEGSGYYKKMEDTNVSTLL
jgi:hypothetical protein